MGNTNCPAAIPGKNVFVIILRNDLGNEAWEEVVKSTFVLVWGNKFKSVRKYGNINEIE